jgi:hypothetical protein
MKMDSQFNLFNIPIARVKDIRGIKSNIKYFVLHRGSESERLQAAFLSFSCNFCAALLSDLKLSIQYDAYR